MEIVESWRARLLVQRRTQLCSRSLYKDNCPSPPGRVPLEDANSCFLFEGHRWRARRGVAHTTSAILSHRLEGPNRLRGLAPQSRFVAAHAVKQGRVKMGKAQETLGDGTGVAGR
jgi:hypothetical protein